jgi:predicted membrane chloride channel (bestrophin family)
MNQAIAYLARIVFSAIIYFILKYFAKDKRKFNRYFFSIYGLIIVFELVFGYIMFKYKL